MNKRSLPIFIISCVMGVLAVVGYMLPPSAQEMPARVLFPNSGGRVIFDHALHMQFKDASSATLQCQSCHHELKIPERNLSESTQITSKDIFACKSCHIIEEKAVFVAEHQKKFAVDESGKLCQACHHTEELETLQVGPAGVVGDVVPCAECHTIPERMDAFHNNCFGCHDTMQKGPGSTAPCAQCHTP